MKKVLDQAHMTPAWCSYAGSMYSVLQSSGLWKEEFWKLYGLSGMAFQFIVHEDCCPSSVTVYDWVNGHYHAMDRLGVFTTCEELFYSKYLHTFSMMQKHCVQNIKQSIDKGRVVIVWAPTPCLEFGLIKGYDEENQLLITEAVNDPHPDPLPYDNLGLSEVPILYCQFVLDSSPIDINKAVYQSLRFGLNEWNKENHIQPQYVCGKKAYDYLIQSMENQRLNAFGLSYILAVYQESKQTLHQFLEWVGLSNPSFSGLEEAAMLYQQIADYFKQLTTLWPFQPSLKQEASPQKEIRAKIKELAQKAKERETRAMKVIEKAIQNG